MTESLIILFDGDCGLCNAALQFVVARDSSRRFQFASLSSAVAGRLLARFEIKETTLESVVLLDGNTAYLRSDAALRIVGQLGRPWRWLGVLRVVPRPVRDWVYDWVARHRHRWFGKRSRCSLPSSEFMARMIE